MNIGIIGSRTFLDYQTLKSVITGFNVKEIDNIISGGAKGADSLGKKFANEYNIGLIEFLPDWSIGRRAGFVRNRNIIKKSDFVFVFWDGSSWGTKNSIDLCHTLKKSYFCYIY